MVQEVVDEECIELRLKIEEKDKHIEEKDKQIANIDKDKCLLRETTLLTQFPDNVQCIYFGMIDDVISLKKDDPLIKFGCSNFFADRIKCHKNTYTNFRLCAAYRVCNKTQVENAIKIHPVLVKHLRKLKIKKIEHKEILSIKTITIDKIDEIIRDIIKNIEYTPENYSKLLEENDTLKREIDLLKIYTPENYDKFVVENEKLKKNIQLLDEKIEDENKIKHVVFKKLVQEKNMLYNKIIENNQIPSNEINSFSKHYTRGVKQKNGLYYFNEEVFTQLDGTRQEVWDGTAYKTTGGLIKKDLIIGAKGTIVSKIKTASSTADNRLMAYMKKIGKVPDL